MNARSSRDRAAIWLGVASILSVVFVLVKGELHFVQMPKAGIPLALLLGVVAVAGGWLSNRALTLASGAGFLAAAATQLALHANAASLANGSNGSTFGLWLGLGCGLLVIGLTPQPHR